MVYVDTLVRTIPRRSWPYKFACHLFADTVEELHNFAAIIGLKYIWFQDKKNTIPYYDLTANKRTLALDKGAKSITREDVVRFVT